MPAIIDPIEILNRLKSLAASAPGDERYAHAIAWVAAEIARDASREAA